MLCICLSGVVGMALMATWHFMKTVHKSTDDFCNRFYKLHEDRVETIVKKINELEYKYENHTHDIPL